MSQNILIYIIKLYIAVGNKLSDELISLSKEKKEKYNIKEEKKEEKSIEKFSTKEIRNTIFFP